MNDIYKKSADIIKKSKSILVFTGAGISVDSGIPPFRGKDGLWEKHDTKFVEIDYFLKHPKECWDLLKKIFYDKLVLAKPNKAHLILAEMESHDNLHAIATQNIDALHSIAGNTTVYELHGNCQKLKCIKCSNIENVSKEILENLPPTCKKCGSVLKPDFVFFGEMLPEYDVQKSFEFASICDLCIIIGTTGIVMPAGSIPYKAKENNATIIEINPNASAYTDSIVDIFIESEASPALKLLHKLK